MTISASEGRGVAEFVISSNNLPGEGLESAELSSELSCKPGRLGLFFSG